MAKRTVCFLLTQTEKALFDTMARYYEIPKTELLRRWIYAEGRDILKPAVDEAIRLGISDADSRDPKPVKQVWKDAILQLHLETVEMQQHLENSGVGQVAAAMSAK